MAWNPFKALSKRAQKASKKQQTRKAKASPSRSNPKSSGKKSGGKKNNNTKPTGTANHRGGTTAASNRRRNQDTYQNRKNRQQQAQKRQEARQQNRAERAKTGGTGQHRGGTTYKRYDTKSKYTTANQRREGANRAKETGVVKTASTVASLTAGTGKYIAERAAGAVSKTYTSASEAAYRKAGSGRKGTTPHAPTKNDRLNDTQAKQRQDYYDARQKQKQREKDIASHGDSFTYTDSKGKKHTQSYAKGGHDVNAKITKAKEKTLEEATKGLSDKEHTLDLANVPIYGKKVKADKERQKAEARAEAAESKLEAVQTAAKDFDKVVKDNGWDDDTVLDNGMTVAKFRSQYLKDANAEMDKALNKSLKSVNKSIEESGKLKFSNKDLGKGGIKLAAEFADYLIPYGATAKGTIKAVEAARAASKAAKAGKILTETAEDGAKIISKAAKNKKLVRKQLEDLIKQGKSKEEALKIVQKKLQSDAKKQGITNELIANAAQDAVLGTSIDLYKGSQEGLQGKDLGKYMAQNAALNVALGAPISAIAGRTGKAGKASLNKSLSTEANTAFETIGKVTKSESQKYLNIIEKVRAGAKVTDEEVEYVKSINKKQIENRGGVAQVTADGKLVTNSGGIIKDAISPSKLREYHELQARYDAGAMRKGDARKLRELDEEVKGAFKAVETNAHMAVNYAKGGAKVDMDAMESAVNFAKSTNNKSLAKEARAARTKNAQAVFKTDKTTAKFISSAEERTNGGVTIRPIDASWERAIRETNPKFADPNKKIPDGFTFEYGGRRMVFLNPNGERKVAKTLAHELAHGVFAKNNEFLDTIKRFAGDSWDGRYKEAEAMYDGVKGADIDEETMCDVVGDYIAENKNVFNFMAGDNPSAFGKVRNYVKGLMKDSEFANDSTLKAVNDQLNEGWEAMKNPQMDDVVTDAMMGDVKFALNDEYAPVFYSKMYQVADKRLGKGKVYDSESILKFFKKKGVSSDEIEWSGIKPWLAEHKKFSKEELLDFIKANSLELKVKKRTKTGEVEPPQFETFSEADFRRYFDNDEGNPARHTTKWDEYSLPNGENYREYEYILPGDKSDAGGYSNGAMSMHWDDTDVVLHSRIQDFSNAAKVEVSMPVGKDSAPTLASVQEVSTKAARDASSIDPIEEGYLSREYSLPDSDGNPAYKFTIEENETGDNDTLGYEVWITNDDSDEVIHNSGFEINAIDHDYDLDSIESEIKSELDDFFMDALNYSEFKRYSMPEKGKVLFVEEIQSDWHNAAGKKLDGKPVGYRTGEDEKRFKELRNKRARTLQERNRLSDRNVGLHSTWRKESRNAGRAFEAERAKGFDGFDPNGKPELQKAENRIVSEVMDGIRSYGEAAGEYDFGGWLVKVDIDNAFTGISGDIVIYRTPFDKELHTSRHVKADNITDIEDSIYKVFEEIRPEIALTYNTQIYKKLVEKQRSLDETYSKAIGKNSRRIKELNEELRSSSGEYRALDEAPPAAPYSNYTDYAMKRAFREAAENGQDYVAWTTAKQQSDRWSDEFAEGYRIEYDQEIPGFVNRYIKQWDKDAKVEKITLAENGEEVWGVKIPDEMKRAILYEGQASFAMPKKEERKELYRILGGDYNAEDKQYAESIFDGIKKDIKDGNDEEARMWARALSEELKDLTDRAPNEEAAAELSGAKKYLREVTFHIPQSDHMGSLKEFKEHLGDYDPRVLKFRKSTTGKVPSRGVDDLWSEMSSEYPEMFPASITDDVERFQRMAEVSKTRASDTEYRTPIPEEFAEEEIEAAARDIFNLAKEQVEPKKGAAKPAEAAKPSEEVSAPKEPAAKPAEEKPTPAGENKPVKPKTQPKPKTPAEPKTEPPAATPRGNATKDELEAFRETDTYKGFMKTKSDYASEPLKRRVDNALKYGLDVRQDVEEFYGLGRDIAALRAKAKNSHTQEHIERYEREANEAYAQQTRIAENIYRDYARHIEKTFGKPHAASDITAVESDGIHTALESVGGADGVAKEIKKASNVRFGTGSKKAQKVVAEEMNDYSTCLRNYLDGDAAKDADMQMARSTALLDNISAKLKANPDDAEAMSDLLKVVDKLGEDGKLPSNVRRSAKMIATATPKGRVGVALKAVNDLNARYGDRVDDVLKLTDDEITRLTVTEPGEELDEIYDEIAARLWADIPATRIEKFNEIRHMFMLANVRTHMRNFFGNLTFRGIRRAGDNLEALLQDKVFRKGIESRGGEVDKVKVAKREIRENNDFLKKEFHEIYDSSGSVSRYVETNRPDGVPIVKQKQLNWLIQKNYKWLEKEDMFTFIPAFKKSYMQYVKAKNWDIKNLTPEQRKMAQDRALFDAEYATFRDASAFSTWLTGKKHWLATKEGKSMLGTGMYRFMNASLEGVIPFVKTPVNIFRRSIDYSPASVVRAFGELMSKDPETFKQGIKHLSTGLTGTGIFGLGFFANHIGAIEIDTQSGEHSGSKYYDSDMGYQDYSLVINAGGTKTSWSIDWVQPIEASLFMGAAFRDMINDFEDGDVNIGTDAIAALFSVTSPVMDASFMSSAKDMLETFERRAAKTDSEGELSTRQALAQMLLGDLPKNYISSAVPQVFSQAANITDKYQRDTSSTLKDPIAASWDSAAKQLVSRIPGFRLMLNRKLDRRGEDKTTTGDNIATKIFFCAINPSNAKFITEDKYDRELYKIHESIKDKSSDDYKYFFYNFTGSPSYDLANGKRMTYREAYDYAKANRVEQNNIVKKMIDAPSYGVMTDEMKVDEVDSAHWIGNMVADRDTYNVNYALKVMKNGTTQRDKHDAEIYKRYKEEGGKDKEAFWDWRVDKERLLARSHASGDDTYRVKGLIAIEQGNDALLAASDLQGNKENELRHYWEIKSKRHGAKAKDVCFDKLSDACCRIVSNLKSEKCSGTSLSIKSVAAGKVAVDHKKIDEEEYRALGHFWNSAQAGGGLMLKYNKKHKYDLPKIEQYSYELKRRIEKRGENESSKDVVMDYIENELKVKNNDERACLYQILYLGGHNSPYIKTRWKNPYKEKIDDHLEWGEDKDDEWGEAKKGKGRGGWGRRGRRGWGGGGWGSGGGGGGVAAEESAVAVSPVTGARYKTPAYTAATAKTSAPQNTRITGTKAKATDWTKQSTLTEAYRKRVRKQMQKNRLV